MDEHEILNGSGATVDGVLTTETEVEACDLEGAMKDAANSIALQGGRGSSVPYPERPSRTDKQAIARRKTFRLIRGGLADE
jgi:hypothetical protein